MDLEGFELPTAKDEDWRFTPVQPLLDALKVLDPAEGPAFTPKPFVCFDAFKLVFVNGRYRPDLSAPAPGVEAFTPSRGAGKGFEGLNAATATAGARVVVDADLGKPLHLLFAASSGMRAWRNELVLRDGARADVVEEYLGESHYFTNAVTKASVGRGAQLTYTKLQRESDESLHVATLDAALERDALLTAHFVSLGASLARNDVRVSLKGEGADASLYGLYLAKGAQHVDFHTVIDHAVAHGSSRELFKGVLDDKARAVFNGLIEVRPGAQKTDAQVYNKNLLLSDKGLVNTKPEFKIHANDVQCKHGATIGQLNADAMFYLRSRGIAAEKARALLILGFAREMVDRLGVPVMREALAAALEERYA